MFRNKTLFVLGAGASFEVGMPIGTKLAEEISSLLDMKWSYSGHLERGDRSFAQLLTKHGFSPAEMNAMTIAARGLRFSNSIDEYLDRFKDPKLSRLGKIAIAYTILDHERNSRVAVTNEAADSTLETTQIAGTWYNEFARALFRSTDRRNLDKLFGNLTIIDFNYDRCVEQFLRYAMRDAYMTDLAEADALLETLAHLRPYGSIGTLRTVANPNGVAFGGNPHRADVEGIVDRLKTYTEQVNTDTVERIKEEFASALTVVFLGFGFHEPNMRLLAPKGRTPISTVIATAKDVSENDTRITRANLAGFCNNHIDSDGVIVRNLTCAQLFHEYRLTLQAA
jgi:hypothetical protein